MRIRRYGPHSSNNTVSISVLERLRRANIMKFLVITGIICSVIFVAFSYIYSAFFLPSIADAEAFLFPEASKIYSREALDDPENKDKYVLYTLGSENRTYVQLPDISKDMRNATLAMEDDRFYSHFGVDIPAFMKAVLSSFGIGPARGGSTITQQLMKNVFLDNRKQLIRKYKEALLAIKMESKYSKDEILELYLNKIFLGSNAYGVEAAARTYFSKNASELSLAESSILVGLIKLPAYLNPYGPRKDELMGYTDEDGVYHKGRKDLVLERMVKLKMITKDEMLQAQEEAKSIEFKSNKIRIKAPHFVFYVQEILEEELGKEALEIGGLQIYTTLNWDLQDYAETLLQERTANYPSKYNATNAALATINPDNGDILAYVGGKDYFDDASQGKFDVLQSYRQPGSTMKPYTYATAFEELGYGTGTVVWDVKTDFGQGYSPENITGAYTGPTTLRNALSSSLNTPAVKLAALAGPANVLEMLTKLGITYTGDAEKHGVAIGIGVAEVQILEHINGYTAFTGDGTFHKTRSLLSIHKADGTLLKEFPTRDKVAGMKDTTAALVRNILTDETSRPSVDGFDWNKYMQLNGYNNGAKTGTSNRVDPKDATKKLPGDDWVIGFTPHLVTGIWMGNNDGTPMKDGATGLAIVAPIWRDYMNRAHEIINADKAKLYTEPTLLQGITINKWNGKRATDITPEALKRTEYYAPNNPPKGSDDIVFTEIPMNSVTFEAATDDTPEYLKIIVKRAVLTSERPDNTAWETPVQAWISSSNQFMMYPEGITAEEVERRKALSDTDKELLIEELETQYKMSKGELNADGTPKEELTDIIPYPDIPNSGAERPIDSDGDIAFNHSASLNFGIISPLNNSIHKASSTVPLSLSIDYNTPIKRLELWVDGVSQVIKTKSPWDTYITLPDTAKDSIPITVEITDSTSKSVKKSIMVSTVAPPSKPIAPLKEDIKPLKTESNVSINMSEPMNNSTFKSGSTVPISFSGDTENIKTIDITLNNTFQKKLANGVMSTTIKVVGLSGTHTIYARITLVDGTIIDKKSIIQLSN